MKESYTAQNSLELNPLQILPTILYRIKNFLPLRKEWTLRLITFSCQPIPVSGWSQKFLNPVVES